MVARLTSNQKAAGSSPASGNLLPFLFADRSNFHHLSLLSDFGPLLKEVIVALLARCNNSTFSGI